MSSGRDSDSAEVVLLDRAVKHILGQIEALYADVRHGKSRSSTHNRARPVAAVSSARRHLSGQIDRAFRLEELACCAFAPNVDAGL